jgi:hypothetical protein
MNATGICPWDMNRSWNFFAENEDPARALHASRSSMIAFFPRLYVIACVGHLE